MNDLAATLDELNARQLGLDGQLRAINRRLTLVSVLIGAVVVLGVLAMLQ